jgi:ABC-type cobalamin/Fe3+-siderophores transport system ATPase subunit
LGHIQVLKGANFYAHKGKVTALVGDNDSGKSTLTKILCRILCANKDTININNKNLKSLTPKKTLLKNIIYL